MSLSKRRGQFEILETKQLFAADLLRGSVDLISMGGADDETQYFRAVDESLESATEIVPASFSSIQIRPDPVGPSRGEDDLPERQIPTNKNNVVDPTDCPNIMDPTDCPSVVDPQDCPSVMDPEDCPDIVAPNDCPDVWSVW